MIVRRYKKWAPLVLPILISALKDSDIDTVKGALHTLRLSTIEHTLARNWDFIEDYVIAVFEAFDNFDRVILPHDDVNCSPLFKTMLYLLFHHWGGIIKPKHGKIVWTNRFTSISGRQRRLMKR